MTDSANISADDVERLVSLRHPDPHSILGAHLCSKGVVVRAYRPEAEQIFVVTNGGPPLPMVRRHKAGLFEAVGEDRPGVLAARLGVHYPGGTVFGIRERN